MKEDGEQKADDKGQRLEGRSQRAENMEAGPPWRDIISLEYFRLN